VKVLSIFSKLLEYSKSVYSMQFIDANFDNGGCGGGGDGGGLG
jgi:hypothetical protein